MAGWFTCTRCNRYHNIGHREASNNMWYCEDCLFAHTGHRRVCAACRQFTEPGSVSIEDQRWYCEHCWARSRQAPPPPHGWPAPGPLGMPPPHAKGWGKGWPALHDQGGWDGHRDRAYSRSRSPPDRRGGKGGRNKQQNRDGNRAEKGGKGDGKKRPKDGKNKKQQEKKTDNNIDVWHMESKSALVEELKHRQPPVGLEDLIPHMSEICRDQVGSKLIQIKFEECSDDTVRQGAIDALLSSAKDLAVDPFGNYVMQKICEHSKQDQVWSVAEQLLGTVLNLSTNMYGCRVVQKLLEGLKPDNQSLFVEELHSHIIDCVKDQHGNHVVQQIIKTLPVEKISFVVDAFEGQVKKMACHSYGCRVLQRLMERCGAAQMGCLLEEAVRHCSELASDEFGNYVVQHILEQSGSAQDKEAVQAVVRQEVKSMARHKYASNVVEKAFAKGNAEDRSALVKTLISESGPTCSDPNSLLMVLSCDKFGNFVVQRALELSEADVKQMLCDKLSEGIEILKKSETPFAKRVLAAAGLK
eukprot:gnl/MRDRNA2_/MRDRNA2_44481_c0_seq1.p1 gnl/MRDRNA2_/MRDRNA2_44481_c0~~gnl/MRDRNA2_/MRDRNA2_44481_c0_seq1.p1  ORF type:complete len:527 (-),score=99.92 gnl/MRDRNA2_/MRDRNA2_44481_c0_seq1:10-1590(-)